MSTLSSLALDVLLCREHGWLAHASVHEAAHAVFAVDLEIPFTSVRLSSPERVWQSLQSGGEVPAGGVHLDGDARDHYPGRDEEALDFSLSGSRAEDRALGHCLDRGFSGDMEVWRRGTGRFDAQDPAELTPMLRASVARVDVRLPERWGAVLAVAEALRSSAGAGNPDDPTDQCAMMLMAAEVRAVLGA
jgi:hypothetical protein